MKRKIYIYSPEKWRKDVWGERIKKAKELERFVKVKYIGRIIIFEVFDPESGKTYEVYYKPDSPIKWSCTCPHFGIKMQFCAHILAVHMYLYHLHERKNPRLTKFFRKGFKGSKG